MMTSNVHTEHFTVETSFQNNGALIVLFLKHKQDKYSGPSLFMDHPTALEIARQLCLAVAEGVNMQEIKSTSLNSDDLPF